MESPGDAEGVPLAALAPCASEGEHCSLQVQSSYTTAHQLCKRGVMAMLHVPILPVAHTSHAADKEK